MGRWTKSQAELRDLAVMPVMEGFTPTMVAAESLSGVSTVIDSLCKRKDYLQGQEPRIIRAYAQNTWEVICCLSDDAKTKGRGLAVSLGRALMKLSNDRAHPLCLMMEEAHLLPFKEVEPLLSLLEWTVRKNELSVHVIFVVNRVYAWNRKTALRELAWPKWPERIMGKFNGTCLKFSKEGLKEIREGNVSEVEQERKEKVA